MWNQLSAPWQACFVLAWEGFCAGTIPIGSVITGPDGTIIARGRNHMFEPYALGPTHLAGVRLAHAEINAILAMERVAVNPRECTLYTSTEPCPQCAGALVMANLRHLCYASRDPWAGSADLLSANDYARSKKIKVDPPRDALFEAVLFAMQTVFFLQRIALDGAHDTNHQLHALIDRLQAAVPDGVALGKRLYACDKLQQMRTGGLEAQAVYSRLAIMLATV